MTVFEVGDDSDKWLVTGPGDRETATFAIIREIVQYVNVSPNTTEAAFFGYSVLDLLSLPDDRINWYPWVYVEKSTKKLYNFADGTDSLDFQYLGCAWAFNFTIPYWTGNAE